MNIELSVAKDRCTKCGRCVKVCPAKIFTQPKTGNGVVELVNVESCIVCGHCVAACPEEAVVHNQFPAEKVHPIDGAQLPTPEQMMLLCKSRRSNRAFSTKPIPSEQLDLILEAAHRAPTGSNAQEVQFTLVTDPEKLRLIIDSSIELFDGMVKKLKNPLFKPLINWMAPGAARYIPVFERLKQEHANGGDPILRKATAVLLIHAPASSRLGAVDANLAYQNGSLMAECLGVSQFYTGFVLIATKQDKKQKLAKALGIEGEIHAGMGLGIPLFRYPNYIDRKEIVVQKI